MRKFTMVQDDRKSKSKSGRGASAPIKHGSSKQTERKESAELKQLHELQVHQVELEMQNEELKKARAELHSSLKRYTALYEFAPAVLLTLAWDGAVVEANQIAATLLRVDSAVLLKRRLGSFVVASSLPMFNACLDLVFHAGHSQECEIELLRDDGSRLFVQITLVLQEAKTTCLVSMIDITARQRLLQQSRQLTRRMFELLENDRRSLAHEIHTELGQWLTAIYAATGAMIRVEHGFQPETRAHIREVNSSTAEMQNVLRRILLRLRPTMLDTVGLTESVRELVNQWCERHKQFSCVFTNNGDLDKLSESLNITIFRIVQDALNNIAKHSNAKNVAVGLERIAHRTEASDEVVLTVTDDGVGFDTAIRSSGLGLLGMRERVIAMDGLFEISSRPGHGATIQARIPAIGKSQPRDL